MEKLTVGPPAEGQNFFDRPDTIEDIWTAIENNSHLLIAAPRRVGKTSIMLKLREEPREGYAVVYITTEAADSEAEFWRKLFNGLIDEGNTKFLEAASHKLSESLHGFMKSITKFEISGTGIEFGEGTFSYAESFEKMITQLSLDKKLVIMVDEFPQTIENIKEYEDEKSARTFLKTNRALRQNPKITEKVAFIYTGSIGLESVADQLGGTKFINDLNSIRVAPLRHDEAFVFIDELLKATNLFMTGDVKEYLIQKIEWLLPFYFQLIIQSLERRCKREGITDITLNTMIDDSINEALQERHHFEHWNRRLKTSFDNSSYKYAKEILNIISENHVIESATVSDISSNHDIDDEREIIHTLTYDGYINNNDDPKIYRFNSPILREWWYRNVAN